MTPLSVDEIATALLRCANRVEPFAVELNELDSRLGDGDLGATLQKCAAQLKTALAMPAPSTDELFKRCAMACARASGSSFGTLLGVAFASCAKQTVGQSEIAPNAMPGLLKGVLDALISRGGASLGDKTVLDPLAAVQTAVTGLGDRESQYRASIGAVEATLAAFRDKPNRIGRARMFAEKSIGMDDPGMVAFKRLLEAIGQ